MHLLLTLHCAYFFVVHCAKVRRVVGIGGPLPPHLSDLGTLSILDYVAVCDEHPFGVDLEHVVSSGVNHLSRIALFLVDSESEGGNNRW